MREEVEGECQCHISSLGYVVLSLTSVGILFFILNTLSYICTHTHTYILIYIILDRMRSRVWWWDKDNETKCFVSLCLCVFWDSFSATVIWWLYIWTKQAEWSSHTTGTWTRVEVFPGVNKRLASNWGNEAGCWISTSLTGGSERLCWKLWRRRRRSSKMYHLIGWKILKLQYKNTFYLLLFSLFDSVLAL